MTFYSWSCYVILDVCNSGSLADLGLIFSQTNGLFSSPDFALNWAKIERDNNSPIILAQIFSFKISVRRITINNVIYNHFISHAISIFFGALKLIHCAEQKNSAAQQPIWAAGATTISLKIILKSWLSSRILLNRRIHYNISFWGPKNCCIAVSSLTSKLSSWSKYKQYENNFRIMIQF